MITKTISTVAVSATLLVAGTALAMATPGQICAAAKQTAAGHKAKSKLTCYAKYTKSGGSFDVATCLAKAEATFAKAFHTAEFTKRGTPRGCTTTGDAAAVEVLVDNFVAAVVGALPAVLPTPSATPTPAPTNTPTPTVFATPTATATPSLNWACVLDAILSWPANAVFQIPTELFSSDSLAGTICPTGADPTATPPICTFEMQLPTTLTQTAEPAGDMLFTGTALFRVADVPVPVQLSPCAPTITMAVDSDGSCPGGAYDKLSLAIDIVANFNNASEPYGTVGAASLFNQAAVTALINGDTSLCGFNASCDATCCANDACACALASTDFTPARMALTGEVLPSLNSTVASLLDANLCEKATKSIPCLPGTTADSSQICRYNNDPNNKCAPAPALFAPGC